MNSRFLISLILGAMPLAVMAQDDDMYFVPSKKNVEHETVSYGMPRSTYYSGSSRSVDEYNRRGGSYYQVVPTDTTSNDIIDFNGEMGVYPDSVQTEDFALTRQMARYDGYEPSVAYREGYRDALNDSWHSPWYYSSYYPWYTSSYYPWYDSYWYWRDPWYYDYYWYHPYGWYGGYHYGYYRPYYHGGGYYYGGNRGRVFARNGNTGTIDRSGRTHGSFSRSTSTRQNRTSSSQATSTYNRSNSGNFSRSTTNSSSGNFSRSSSVGSSSSGSFSRSGGGSFSSGGGSRGGGGFGRVSR